MALTSLDAAALDQADVIDQMQQTAAAAAAASVTVEDAIAAFGKLADTFGVGLSTAITNAQAALQPFYNYQARLFDRVCLRVDEIHYLEVGRPFGRNDRGLAIFIRRRRSGRPSIRRLMREIRKARRSDGVVPKCCPSV